MNIKNLPDKLSEAFRGAVQDANRTFNAETGVTPHSGVWYATDHYGECAVCLVGAILRKSGIKPQEGYPTLAAILEQNKIAEPLHLKMLAIEHVRQAEYVDAAMSWNGSPAGESFGDIEAAAEKLPNDDLEILEWSGFEEWTMIYPRLLRRAKVLAAMGL